MGYMSYIWNFYEIVKVAKHLFNHHEMDVVCGMNEATLFDHSYQSHRLPKSISWLNFDQGGAFFLDKPFNW
jgi:hypothetical protein